MPILQQCILYQCDVYIEYVQMGLECIAEVNQTQAAHKSSQGLCETGQKRTESIYSNKS